MEGDQCSAELSLSAAGGWIPRRLTSPTCNCARPSTAASPAWRMTSAIAEFGIFENGSIGSAEKLRGLISSCRSCRSRCCAGAPMSRRSRAGGQGHHRLLPRQYPLCRSGRPRRLCRRSGADGKGARRHEDRLHARRCPISIWRLKTHPVTSCAASSGSPRARRRREPARTEEGRWPFRQFCAIARSGWGGYGGSSA